MAPASAELLKWLVENSSTKQHDPGVRPRKLRPDFDANDLFDHYNWELADQFTKDGIEYFVFGSCPIKGEPHTDGVRSKKTCLIVGKTVGFKCMVCDEYDYHGLIEHMLEQGYEEYPNYVYADEDDSIASEEKREAPYVLGEPNAQAENLFPAEKKCYRKNCTCGLEHVETSMAPEKRAALDKILREADEEEEGRERENPAPPNIISAERLEKMMSREARFAAYVDVEPQEIPNDALYGQMGRWARAMELPLSIAYPAILTCYSALPKYDEILGVRFNLFTAIPMPVGGGKNLALDRAVKILGLREGQDYMDATMGGAGGLFNAIGNKMEGKGKQKIEIPGPRKMLINAAEFAATMINCKLDNSTLAAHLCNLWDKNCTSSPIQSGKREANCRVSILGALPIEKDAPEAFRKYFGEETGRGLHSRMILAYHDSKIDNRWAERWGYSPEANDVTDYVVATNPPERWSPEAESYYSTMQLPNDFDGRALYNLKRVCLLTATANGDKVLSLDCLKSAELFMLWQMQLKNFFRYGESERVTPGELSVTVMSTLRRIAKEGKYERSPVIGGVLHINLARVVHNFGWEKYGVEAVQWTVASLIKLSQLQQGKKRNTKSKIVSSKHHVVVTDFPSE